MLTYTTTFYTTTNWFHHKPVTSSPYPFKINCYLTLPSTPRSVKCGFLTLSYDILCVFHTTQEYNIHLFPPHGATGPSGSGSPIIKASRSHPDTPHSVGLLWTTETLPDHTQLSQETDIHAAGGIRKHNPSKKAAADPRLRPRGQWDRPFHLTFLNLIILSTSWWRAPVLSPRKPQQVYCPQYLVLRHPHQSS